MASDSWGVWQAVQSPAETGPCTTLNSTWSAWQVPQRSFSGDVRSFGSLAACGSWQVVQVPSLTGAWTRAFLPKASWQLAQRAGCSAVSLKVFLPFCGCGVATDSWQPSHDSAAAWTLLPWTSVS